MSLDIPSVFEGTVEVDETHLGGQKKDKSKKQLKKEVKVYVNQKGVRGQQSNLCLGYYVSQGKFMPEQ